MKSFEPASSRHISMAPRILERMYKRSPNAPPSRRVHGGYNLVYMTLRHVVFDLVPESADFVTDILCDMYTEPELIRLCEEARTGHSGELMSAMLQARRRWTLILRDNQMADVRVIILPARINVTHRDRTMKYPFGTQDGRFTELKEKLVREAAGMPYHSSGGRDPVTGNMSFDMVMLKKSLHEIMTDKYRRQKGVNIKFLTSPAPGPNTNLKQDPGCIFRYETIDQYGEIVYDKIPTQPNIVRKRSPSIERLRIKGPNKAWNSPYTGAEKPDGKPHWNKQNAPFSKEVFDPDSNDNWWRDDYKVRAAQIAEWKQEREERMRTGVEPDPEVFDFLEPMCDVYTSDRNYAWRKTLCEDEEKEFRQAHAAAANAQQAHVWWQKKLDQVLEERGNPIVRYQTRQHLKSAKIVFDRALRYIGIMQQGRAAAQNGPGMQTPGTPMEESVVPESIRSIKRYVRDSERQFPKSVKHPLMPLGTLKTNLKEGPPGQPMGKAVATVADPTYTEYTTVTLVVASGVPHELRAVRCFAEDQTARRDSGVSLNPLEEAPVMPGPAITPDDDPFVVPVGSCQLERRATAAPMMGARGRSGGVPMARLPTNRNRSGRDSKTVVPQQDSQEEYNEFTLPTMKEKLAEVKKAMRAKRMQKESPPEETVHEQAAPQTQSHHAAADDLTPESASAPEARRENVPNIVIPAAPETAQASLSSSGDTLPNDLPFANACSYRSILVSRSRASSAKKEKKRVSFRTSEDEEEEIRGERKSHVQSIRQYRSALLRPTSDPEPEEFGFTSGSSSPPDDLMYTQAYSPTEVGSSYDSPVGSPTVTPDTTPNISRRDSMSANDSDCSPISIRAPQTGKRIDQLYSGAASSLKVTMELDGFARAAMAPSKMQRLLSRISSSA
ncbi:unnamed protein product [Zymoseptoria tritici ST99CH_3D7]|uniref:Uncharacterized protein n=1 Tax=Zymoseptoria tritici (strain ST99CH_3D7) TaxID=1276538 RepID=A0A1X7RFF4_ZYMT9|nr:unnamed protein product [Zymoseptoria tritici ST99CH_3D7]